MIEDLEEIGSGGFGVIRKVRLPDKRIAALKIFRPLWSLQGEDWSKLRRRFEREVEVQSNLPEDLFIPVLLKMLDGSPLCYAMAYAERNFESEIQAWKGEHVRMRGALLNIIEGMQYLEDNGFVHRDL